EILCAVYEARGDAEGGREWESKLHALGEAPPASEPPPPPGAGALSSGQSAFVAATRVRLRKSASTNAPVVVEAPIGAELKVRSVSSDWAEVEWVPPAVLEVDLRRPD